MKNSSSAAKESKTNPPRLKGWKRWAFPLIAMLVIPTLFFVLLEGTLRLVNYGFPSAFLLKREVGGKTVYTDNRQYGWRFFPQKVARRPTDIVLPATKAPKTFRVVVLGESAAMGDPDTAYGIPRILEVMLEERYPDVQFEVVNAAMTGISSHIIQDIAKDCAKVQPDCFVIYMGNNEAIGPYGPGTVFASFSRNLALTRLSINARSLKTSQLLDRIVQMRSKDEEPGGWGGLRVFMKSQLHPSDHRLTLLGEHFEANLREICEAGHKAGAKLVLCTVASSLADCSPFASLSSPSLSADAKREWDSHWAAAEKLEKEGNAQAALKEYDQAEVIDPSFAELHFRKGRLYAALRRHDEANASFSRARDFDALRFRTATDLNNRIREVAGMYPASDAALADVVKTIEQESTSSGVGSAHFVDHVHFNFHGNYVAAKEIMQAVSRFVPESAPNDSAVISEQECADRLAFTRWNELAINEHMLSRFEIPPFNTKADYAERVHELKKKVATLQDARTSPMLEKANLSYKKALERSKTDPHFLRNLAELSSELDRSSEEIEYRKTLFELFPYDPDRKALLAETYSRNGKTAEAETLAKEVLKLDPSHFVAHLALATVMEKRGEMKNAAAALEAVLRTRPDLVAVRQRLEAIQKGGQGSPTAAPGSIARAPEQSMQRYQKGQALVEEGKVADGIKELQASIQLDPLFAEAYSALAGALVQQGRTEEAIAQCKEGLRLRPDFIDLHNNLGALLTDLSRFSEARTHLQEAIRLNPDHDDARLNLALNLMRDKKTREALTHFEAFIKRHSTDPELHLQMGILYEGIGNWQKAANAYREALKIRPNSEQYQSYLAWVLATSPQDDVRDGKEALRLAEAAIATGKQAYSLDAFAAALAESDRYPEAIKAAENARTLAQNANDAQAVEDITRRIALYKNNKPFRSVPTAEEPASTVR